MTDSIDEARQHDGRPMPPHEWSSDCGAWTCFYCDKRQDHPVHIARSRSHDAGRGEGFAGLPYEQQPNAPASLDDVEAAATAYASEPGPIPHDASDAWMAGWIAGRRVVPMDGIAYTSSDRTTATPTPSVAGEYGPRVDDIVTVCRKGATGHPIGAVLRLTAMFRPRERDCWHALTLYEPDGGPFKVGMVCLINRDEIRPATMAERKLGLSTPSVAGETLPPEYDRVMADVVKKGDMPSINAALSLHAKMVAARISKSHVAGEGGEPTAKAMTEAEVHAALDESMRRVKPYCNAAGAFVGAPGNWIAPVHNCPRCGASLNWREFGGGIVADCRCGQQTSYLFHPPLIVPGIAPKRAPESGGAPSAWARSNVALDARLLATEKQRDAALARIKAMEERVAAMREALAECLSWMRCDCGHPACKRCPATKDGDAALAEREG